MSDQTPSGDAPTALYRRYRPTTLRGLVGQPTVSMALSKALEGNRVSHAYLFSGPRGTGKTSAARILAKAVNCAEPNGVEPCGKCTSCTSITAGNSFDVRELDAASNNGVDAIRELVASAALVSANKRRVFVIDEVHMLSNAASNALLKTLEEPPPHVIFVLATTDPQKVLPTVRSRTQQLEFKLVKPEALREHLARVARHAKLDVSDEVLDAAVRRGNGSVRDALSALDTLVGTGVEAEAAPSAALIDALAEADLAGVFRAVAAAVGDGTDARVLAEETLATLREFFLIQMGASDLVLAPNLEALSLQAAKFTPRSTVAVMDALGDALAAMRADHDRRVNLEVCLARYCKQAQKS